MSRALIILRSRAERERAIDWIRRAPTGTRVEFKAAKRTIEQNALLWSRLTDIARQIEWHGAKRTTGDWKALFMDALRRETLTVPSIDGKGFVNLGRSSSDLSKEEFGNLLDLIDAFAAEHGVRFHDQHEDAA